MKFGLHNNPGKPRYRFRLDLNFYRFLCPTTMSDIEIFDRFTKSILGWQLSLLFVEGVFISIFATFKPCHMVRISQNEVKQAEIIMQ